MPLLRNSVYFCVGLATLLLVYVKHRLAGYSTPTSFSPMDWKRAAQHANSIVEDYRTHGHINGRRFEFEGARVLELGPGGTLGTGVLLAGLGIRSYVAIDAFPLAGATPAKFYCALSEGPLPAGVDRQRVVSAARSIAEARTGLIDYAVDPAFKIKPIVGDRLFDLIVSNAAFEHFDDVDQTIVSLSECAAPGALFMAMVDFQSHSRPVRQRDPNNIYRFSAPLYRALHFPGQPNRLRPKDYMSALAKNGWINTTIRSVDTAGPEYLAWSQAALDSDFRAEDSEMHVLTGVIVAERPR